MDTELLAPSQVMANELPDSSKGKVLTTILGLLFIVFVGVSSYLLGAKSVEPVDLDVMPTVTATPTPTAIATSILTPTATPTMTATPIVSTQSNIVSIGKNSKITLPTGWYVSGIISDYKTWTKDEMARLMDDQFKGGEATIPIHKSTKVTLSNANKSRIVIEHEVLYILGGIGFGPLEELAPSEKVVVAPTSTLKGFSRVLQNGTYVYHVIAKCTVVDEYCKTYAKLPEILNIKYQFSGKGEDLAVADKFYKDNLLNKDFSFSLD